MLKKIFSILVVGISSGLAGTAVALLLHTIQHLAYGFSTNGFLAEVSSTLPEQRVGILILCGIIGGVGWWVLKHRGKALVTIEQAMGPGLPKMPLVTTVFSDLLQVVTVAMGSPLGREIAPRELGALLAGRISKALDITPEDTRVLIACGAGAGLGAVYNVPLAGALFAIEVLLRQLSWRNVLTAVTISWIAVMVSWIGLGNVPQYHIADLTLSGSLIAWSLLTAPLFSLAGTYFSNIANKLRVYVSSDWKLPVLCLINFTTIGFLAIYFPALLGNGKSAAGLEFSDLISLQEGAILLALRILITLSSIAVGAMGGLLTPSVAIGALGGGILGSLWSLIWPGSEVGSFALVGAAVFLGSSQRMPLTAMVIMLELTHANGLLLIPMICAVAFNMLCLFAMTAQAYQKPSATEPAILAGGCFWGMEEILRKVPGVIQTEVGYTGGKTPKPTYEQVRTGKTGHAEAIRITFDPKKISYEDLLKNWFFKMHDPTTLNQQGYDMGSQYRSAIFYTSEAQKKTAESVKKQFPRAVTQIVQATEFTPAEDYHQDYLQKNPGGYTCHYLKS